MGRWGNLALIQSLSKLEIVKLLSNHWDWNLHHWVWPRWVKVSSLVRTFYESLPSAGPSYTCTCQQLAGWGLTIVSKKPFKTKKIHMSLRSCPISRTHCFVAKVINSAIENRFSANHAANITRILRINIRLMGWEVGERGAIYDHLFHWVWTL